MENNNLLTQHAFCTNHSTEITLTHMTDERISAFIQGKLVFRLLDFTAVFNLIDHTIILKMNLLWLQ